MKWMCEDTTVKDNYNIVPWNESIRAKFTLRCCYFSGQLSAQVTNDQMCKEAQLFFFPLDQMIWITVACQTLWVTHFHALMFIQFPPYISLLVSPMSVCQSCSCSCTHAADTIPMTGLIMPTYQHLYMCKRLQSIPYCACFHTCCVSFKVGEESLPMYSNSYRNVIVCIDVRLKNRPRAWLEVMANTCKTWVAI